MLNLYPRLKLSSFLFLLFLVHISYNLERTLFVNEVFSGLGLIYLFAKLLSNRMVLNKVEFWIVALFLILLFYGIFSYLFLNKGNLYEFLRTTVVIYSIPSFFLGIYFVDKGNFSREIKNKLGKFIHTMIMLPVFHYGGRMSNITFFPIILLESKYSKAIIFFILLGFVFIKGEGTSYIFLLSYMAYVFLAKVDFFGSLVRSFITSYFVWALILLLFFISLSIFIPFVLDIAVVNLPNFLTGGKLTADNIKYIEGNGIWRLAFWSYIYDYLQFGNLFYGIGFGTPIFDVNDQMTQFISDASPNDKHLPYTIGTHNSYIYIFARTGIIGIFLLLVPHFILFRKIILYRLYRVRNIFLISCAFLFMIDISFFNVVLESAMLSSIYWIIFGVLTKFVYLHCEKNHDK